MQRALPILLGFGLLACHNADVKPEDTAGDGSDTQLPGDTADTDDTSDSEDTSDTAGTTDTSTPDTAFITDVTAWLDDDVGSLAWVHWNQEDAAHGRVLYSFDEGEWLSTPEADFAAGEHEELLLGIPYGSTVEYYVELEVDGEAVDSHHHSIDVEDTPDGFPRFQVLVDEEELRDPTANYLFGSVNAQATGWGWGDYWKFILDRRGRLVWALLTPDQNWTLYVRVSRNGEDLLWDEATYWSTWDGGEGSMVYRMKIDGTQVAAYSTPGLHHAFTELPDGTIVWGKADDRNDDEQLVELLPDGTTRTIWDCQEFQRSVGLRDSCQSNSLYWNESTDSFLYSFYTSDGIVEIDHETGESLRWFGTSYRDAYDFDPPSSAFYWQHGVSYTDAGTLLVSTYRSRGNSNLVVREYEVDDEAHALHQVWVAGMDQRIEGDTNGDAHRLPGGNTLRNFGSGGRIQEVTPDDEVVWDVDFGQGHMVGRTIYLEDLYAFAP